MLQLVVEFKKKSDQEERMRTDLAVESDQRVFAFVGG